MRAFIGTGGKSTPLTAETLARVGAVEGSIKRIIEIKKGKGKTV